MTRKKQLPPNKPHKWGSTSGYCSRCGCEQNTMDATEPCEPEGLSAWCAPGESVKEMLQRAAERD